ncbi:MAG: InlB B-repeat-containing protein [Oscillospiraceae bacterium]|nr:InlB B-repeat-containing protein [Oscillospiraceae bacterium]
MKHPLKKILALVLSVLLVMTMLPTIALAGNGIAGEGRADTRMPNDYIPFERHGSSAVSDAYARGDMAAYNRLLGRTANRGTLPSSYDSRDYGYITSVKNQNPYGTCWTFGTMAPIEAYMIKHGIINKATGAAATTSMDLSEYHLAWFTYTNAYDAEGMLTGDKTTAKTDSSASSYLDRGGNYALATYTLMRWEGAASESTSALAYSKASTSGLNSQYAYAYNVAHVTDATWINASDRDAVKQAIMEYGAGTISYYHSDSYLNTSTYAYYYNAGTSSNHAVTVVGWDDNYAVSNFKSGKRPSNPGAWIIKNSWASSWGNNGYFYLSYEDTSVANSACCFYKVAAEDNYAHCYQYDGTGNVVNYQSMGNNCQIANIFTANGTQSLKAVALSPWDEATTYTLYIYTGLTSDTNPSSGTLAATQSGYLPYSGYFTIPLDQSVSLTNGEKFSVVFKLSTPEPDPDENNTYVHIPYDATSSDVSWVTFTHTNHGNTSYYKEANGSWTNVPNNGDFRIKAYTDDASYTVTAVSNNTSYGTVSVNGNKITASPKTGYYVSDAQVTSGTATVSINGNVITVNASSDCTVKVIFAAKPQYTVTYKALGNTLSSTTAYIQDVINLPSTATAVDGYTFVGWTASTVAETTEKPSYYAPGAEYTVTANATLHALYTRSEGSGEIVYEIVSEPITDWAGKYVVTCGKDSSMLVLKGLSGNTSYESSSAGGAASFSATGMTLDNGVLKNVGNAYIFEAASADGGWSLKNASTGTYLGSYNSYLYSRSSYSSSYCVWSLEYDTYNICMKLSNAASSSYPYLVKGSNSYFVINSGYTTNKTQLWKQTTASTTYYNTNPSATHSHTAAAAVQENYVAPSCTAAGSYDEVVYCATCGEELSRTTKTVAALGHNAGSPVQENYVAPTETVDGGYDTVTYCTRCNAELSRTHTTLPATGPTVYYTVSFSVPAAVTAPASQTVAAGGSVTLPTAGAPDGYSFVGWVTAACENVTVKPTVLTGSYTPAANVTLYALYSFTEGSGGDTVYQLADAFENGGKYILVASGAISGTSGKAVGNTAVTSSHYLSPVAVTVNSDNTVTASSANLPKVLWVASGNSTNGYTLYNEAVGKYMGLDSSEYLAPTASGLAWTYTSNQYLDNKVDSEGYYYLSYSSSSTVRYTTSKSGAVIKLYKQTSTGATYYTTVIGESTHTHTAAAAVQENYAAPTCTAAGSYDEVVYCATCGEELSRTHKTVAALGHNAGMPVQENYVAPTETTDGGYDTVTYCTRCNAELSRTHTTLPATGVTTYTVSFTVPAGVAAVASMSAEANSYITLPTAGAPEGYTFLGWVTETVNNSTTAPSNILTGSYKVTGNITLKALYSYTETGAGGETAYELLSAAPSDWTGSYLITYGTNTSSLYVLKGLSGNNKYESSSNGSAVLYSNTGMSYADGYMTGVTNAYVWNIAKTGSYYTIQNASTNTYLANKSNYLYSQSSYSSSYCRWTLSCSSGNITAKNTGSSRYPYLSFSSSNYFMVNRSVPTGLYFWKQTTTSGSTVTYYTT